ncbi:alpha/beta hydrolase-fold protein, partial [Paraburkholderia sediminicola]|uniref:alpha/beta hydrolase-fold protein n=1 Tax=Paraburkholderia sediminicola TaxID=458836 RepID=UPI0038BAC635
FAPIAAPSQCPWGVKAFSGYLGEDREAWRQYDSSELVAHASRKFAQGILVDQGLADQFLAEQLNPDVFEAACKAVGQPLTMRRHAGYDHGYYFISTFIEDHLAHHAKVLLG